MIATTNGAIVNALTVDVEDYYQVQRSEERRVGKECRKGCSYRW